MSTGQVQHEASPKDRTLVADSITTGSIPLLTFSSHASQVHPRNAVQDEPVTPAEWKEGGLQGWTVVAGSAVTFFVTVGLVYCWGVLQSELLKRQYANSSTLGWVSSTTVCLMPLFAIPVTTVIRHTNNRTVGLVGALCTGCGYIATSYTFDASVATLFCAQSLFGLGYCLSFWSSNSLAGQYFERKRALATGIVYAGSGLGGAVLAIGLSRLIAKVGLETAVRIYGGMALALLIPASFTLKERKEIQPASFRFAYLKQTNFVLLTIATALMTFSLFVPPFFLPSYAVAAGYTAETGAWLLAGYNFASAAGRLLFGFIADSRVGPVTSLCAAMLLMAISILAIWMTSMGLLAPLIVFLLVNGAASGALLSLQPPVMASLYGLSEMAITNAMVTMSRAAGSALGPPIAGYLLDAFSGDRKQGGTHPFLVPIGVMGAISVTAASSLLALRWRLAGMDLKKRI